MALNYSHRPLYPPYVSEDNLASPMRIVNGSFVEGSPEDCWEACGRSRRQVEVESRNPKSVRYRVDGCGSPESTSNDIIDLLPADPFGMMDIETTVTAITGWFEDLHVDYGEDRINSSGASQNNYGLLVNWNFILNYASMAQAKESAETLKAIKIARHVESDIEGSSNQHDFKLTQICGVGDTVGSSSRIGNCSADKQTGEADGAAEYKSVVHEVLSCSLGYLGVKELLSLEKLDKALYSEVRAGVSLWSSIHIDQPLNEKITDDVLVQLASRAKGKLQCLSLVECLKVTLDGLGRILETNPRLTKLCVPGCTRLSVEGILNLIKAHNSREGVVGIKLVRIGGLNVVKPEHFEDLKLLLGVGHTNLQQKPHYYSWGNVYLPCDDDRAIDVEECPRCEKFRMVYDCPAEGCQAKDKTCRACKICIPRCDQCGTCIDERVFEETFCLDVLCADCYRQPVRYQGAAYEPGQLIGAG